MHARHQRRIGLLLAALGLLATARAQAAEPNNTPGTSTVLPSGTLLINDSLDGRAGRPNTLLGQFDATGLNLLQIDDNSSPLGNNFASQLSGVAVQADGSAFFKLTGFGDNSFTGLHTQTGKYAWYLDVRDPDGQIVPSLSQWQNDELSPGNLDSIWLLPAASPDPSNPTWAGYTVDLTINNVIGPGTGDSLDFFTFTGLAPFQEFTAYLEGSFSALIAQYNGNTRVITSADGATIPTLTGIADALGNVKIGVTGAADLNFTGAHVAVGDYRLMLVVPEPASLGLLVLGAGLVGGWRLKFSGRRKNLRRA